MSRPPLPRPPRQLTAEEAVREAERAATRALHLRARQLLVANPKGPARRLAHLAWAFLRGRRFRQVEPVHRIDVRRLDNGPRGGVAGFGPDMRWRSHVLAEMGSSSVLLTEENLPSLKRLTAVVFSLVAPDLFDAAGHARARPFGGVGREMPPGYGLEAARGEVEARMQAWLDEPAADRYRHAALDRALRCEAERQREQLRAEAAAAPPAPDNTQFLLFDRAVAEIGTAEDGRRMVVVPVTQAEADAIGDGRLTVASIGGKMVPNSGTR